MQRRSGLGKGLARISPPSQHSLTGMGINTSTRSWWYRRSFGVPNRIWALLLAFVSIVTLTRHLRPSFHHQPQPFSTVGLVPKNYLNEANYFATNSSEEGGEVSGNPFDFCPVFGPGDDIAEKYGVMPLAQSRLHLGSGGRIHRVIHKALLGQPVTMSVLGGSGESFRCGSSTPRTNSLHLTSIGLSWSW
jgi:hypothetical protein